MLYAAVLTDASIFYIFFLLVETWMLYAGSCYDAGDVLTSV
jgi:hypothetical protein